MHNAPHHATLSTVAGPAPFPYPFVAEPERTAATRDELVEAHYPQVWHVARSLARRLPSSVEIDDLVGAGALGLMAAADRYQPDRGIAFKTYAEMRIRGAMLDYLRDIDWAPRRLRRAQRSVRAVTGRIEATEGSATDERMAEALGVSVGDYQGLRQSLDNLAVLSFDAISAFECGATWSMPVTTPAEQSPLAEYERAEQRERLALAIEMLSERERQVISMSFVDELSLREIGTIFGVTESRVSQIRSQALRTLRCLLAVTDH
jgi:RNA polymerase sigma factor for flagellar operon FliA